MKSSLKENTLFDGELSKTGEKVSITVDTPVLL